MDRHTVDIYEAKAHEYVAARTTKAMSVAHELRELSPAGVRLDLGSGPGWYTAELGGPSVALDAARSMLERTDPTLPRVQADLNALPFRDGAAVAAFANRSYVHVPTRALPMALWDLQRVLQVGAPVRLMLFEGEHDGPFDNDDLGSRFFGLHPRERMHDLAVGAGFSDVEVGSRGDDTALVVRANRARTLADTVGGGMRLLMVGLNPSLYAADVGVGFARPGNRFWPALAGAGIGDCTRDPRALLAAHHIGMTDLVKRASAGADELTADEYREGLARLDRLCSWLRPVAVCFLGLAGWRAAVERQATTGWQRVSVGGCPVYVMPNPSGLNAHDTIASLADHLRHALDEPPT